MTAHASLSHATLVASLCSTYLTSLHFTCARGFVMHDPADSPKTNTYESHTVRA